MPLIDLTPELSTQIADRVKKGEWPDKAAIRLGATRAQWKAWVSAGDENEERWHLGDAGLTAHQALCAELVWKVAVAEADLEEQMIRGWRGQLQNPAGRATWQGYCTMLERRFPDRWRKREMSKELKPAASVEDELRRMSDPKAAREALD